MTDRSSEKPRALFRPLAVPQVDVRGFWGDRVDAVASRTADILYQRCVDAGMLDQIDPDRPPPGVRIPFHVGEGFTARTVTTQMFWDSDIGKTIETAAYSLYRKPNPALEAKIDAIVDMYAKLQQEDGYLSSWYQRVQPGLRWTNLRDCHELYCAGHLIEGAVAYFQATGKRKFLDVMCRYADHISAMFGPEPDKRKGYCGHEEIELALVKLARATGMRKYLDLAKYFIDERGRSAALFRRRRPARAAPTRRISTSRPTNTTSRTSRFASRTRSSAMPCGRCISIPGWPTSRPNTATKACAPRWIGCGTISTRRTSTSPAG